MAYYPSTPKPNMPFKETINKPALRKSYDGGYEQSRPKYTRSTKTFELNYKALNETDADTLSSFFETYQGDSFLFVHPATSVEYTVRFKNDSLAFDYVGPALKSTTVTLEEV